MRKTWSILCITIIASIGNVVANYHGPFVLWGLNGMNGIKTSALDTLDDRQLRDFYAKATSIVVFLKNATTRLDEENFPNFKEMINENEFIYLTQDALTSDPLDYNANAEVRTDILEGFEVNV